MRIFSLSLSLVSATCISCFLLHIVSSIVRHCFTSCIPEHCPNGPGSLGSVCDLNVHISITYLLVDICGRTALRRLFTL
ncbi:hypothetical protein V8D89_013567 [Ganoderma adspersum]